MRDQGGGVLFSSPIERKKVSVKLNGREEGNEGPRRRPGYGGESNYGNGGGAKLTESLPQVGAGRLKGGSSIASNSNGGRSYHDELHSSTAAKVSEEGLLPQWGRGKRSRCSRPEASNKYAPSPSPVRESSTPPPLKKSIPNGQTSSKLRSQSSSKPPPSKLNALERPVSRNATNNKSIKGSAHVTGLDSARQTAEGKERGLSQQKKAADYGIGRQQQKSEGSDLATTNNGEGNCTENISTVYQTNGTSAMAEGNGLDCTKPKLEWPRIIINLTRKEKEEDFLVFKGAKLPQRPKKRLKVVEKALLFCTPGNWLGDISRGRYDVREKKITKKKPRGLKAMDSVDTDSE